MKIALKLVAVLPVLALLSTACSMRLPAGANTVDMSEIDYSKVNQMRSGETCEGLLFSLIPLNGSVDVIDAIKAADVDHVTAIEVELTSYVFYAKRCVRVFGDNNLPKNTASGPAPAPEATE